MMNSKLLMTVILPMFMMQDEGGDNTPSREQLFLQGLGLSEDVQKILNDPDQDITQAVSTFKDSFSGVLKQTHLSQWDEDKKNALIKETQNGSHMAFQSKLLKTFELDAEQFKDVDKKTEAILTAAQKKYIDQITGLKKKMEGLGDASAKQLQEQLDTRNQQYTDLEKQVAELKKLQDDLPNIKQQIIQAERDRAWVEIEVAKAVDQIENKNAAASLNLINLLLSQSAKLEVTRDEQGNKGIMIKNAQTDAPFMRTETDNYKDLTKFIKTEILEKNKLINLQNPPSDNGGQGGNPAPQSKGGRKQNAIHPNAQV